MVNKWKKLLLYSSPGGIKKMITHEMILRIIPNMREQKWIQRAKRFKILDSYFSFHGLEFNYPICCIMWFCFENNSIRVKIPEYNVTGDKLPERILCPDCLIRELQCLK